MSCLTIGIEREGFRIESIHHRFEWEEAYLTTRDRLGLPARRKGVECTVLLRFASATFDLGSLERYGVFFFFLNTLKCTPFGLPYIPPQDSAAELESVRLLEDAAIILECGTTRGRSSGRSFPTSI